MQLYKYFSLTMATLIGLGMSISFASPPGALRVLTYNIHHAEGIDGKLDMERIARVINSAQPDIVALQEVDQGTDRTLKQDQPAMLSQLTKMTVLFGKNIDYQGGGYGNAVLSRLPMKLLKNIKLPCLHYGNGTDDSEQRGALVVEIKTPKNGPIVFVATHLDSRHPDRERLASAKLLNNCFNSTYHGRTALLAGDLNATPTSPVLQRFGDAWHNATSGELATVSSQNPTRQIDFVLCRPVNHWKILEVKVLNEPLASDHLPVLTVLEIVKK